MEQPGEGAEIAEDRRPVGRANVARDAADVVLGRREVDPGGGIPGNLPRVLPESVSVELSWGAWPVPPIFAVLQDLGGISEDEMPRVFNMGLGLIFVGPPTLDARSECPSAIEVGRVVPRQTERVVFRR